MEAKKQRKDKLIMLNRQHIKQIELTSRGGEVSFRVRHYRYDERECEKNELRPNEDSRF